MAFTSTHTFRALYINTSTVSYAAGDAVLGVTDITVSETRTVLDTHAIGDDTVLNLVAARTAEISIEGYFTPGTDGNDAPITAYEDGSLVQVWVLTSTGPDAGFRYPCLVQESSYSEPTDGLVKWTAKFILSDAPVAF